MRMIFASAREPREEPGSQGSTGAPRGAQGHIRALYEPYKALARGSFGLLGPWALRVPIIGIKGGGGLCPPPHTGPSLVPRASNPEGRPGGQR